MKWSLFLEKIGLCMGLLSNFVAAHPYQNQTGVTPPPRSVVQASPPTDQPNTFLQPASAASTVRRKSGGRCVLVRHSMDPSCVHLTGDAGA